MDIESLKNTIMKGDALENLKLIPSGSIDMCVTSPPYFNLRDYGHPGQIGNEATPELFIQKLVDVFREVKRTLKDDGTLWVNIGDSYWGSGKGYADTKTENRGNSASRLSKKTVYDKSVNIKNKDLIGIPWMLAFALRADGWYLRQDIIWHKPNCMPESVTDRCTKSHEYIFMLSKSAKYYYDQDSIKEPAIWDVDGNKTAARKARVKDTHKSLPTEKVNALRKGSFKDAAKFNGKHQDKQRGHSRRHAGFNDRWDAMTKEQQCTGMRNKRSVWSISPAQFREAHFATFPEKLVVPCIKAGSPRGGVILDPFFGAGTTGLVARKLNRDFIGIELSEQYIRIAETRLSKELGLFA
ncbi:DNA-methyltransferase [Albibacterium profundi]|uniref:Methyltransferase n=1 Tax=Albibacterium profundi TaxID=3134906 RepID=A0ABV5CFD3_9SPHI